MNSQKPSQKTIDRLDETQADVPETPPITEPPPPPAGFMDSRLESSSQPNEIATGLQEVREKANKMASMALELQEAIEALQEKVAASADTENV